MKAFTNTNVRDLKQAVTVASEARRQGRKASFAGGGTDLLQLAKERVVQPDVIVNLKTVAGQDRIAAPSNGPVGGVGLTIGGLTTLDTLSANRTVRQSYAVLAEAAESVATPQIRNVGTVAGNVCQRPWCWYFRNGFPCLKNGGTTCFSVVGENQFHAIFGGGPSYIVHPSDTAVAFLALDARFRIVGPGGERVLPAAEFFVLPRENAARENVLGDDDVLASVEVPRARAGTRSMYHKILDREAWTHAVVSAAIVLELDQSVCRSARVVLGGVAPIPWRLPEVERMLTGQRMTPELAARAGEQSVVGARPLQKNAYKIPLVKGVVKRTLLELSGIA